MVLITGKIQFARRYDNGAVRNYDTVIQTFPGVLIARLARFEPAEFFELANPQERLDPEVKL